MDRPDGATCFDYTTLPALTDLQSPRWQELFAFLERQQSDFLEQEDRFRSREYKWPRDPLHNWARIWEYPFAYHNIEKWRRSWAGAAPPQVVDLGSGVTFFPFAIARLGCQVTCADIDPVCGTDIARASQFVPAQPGAVDFRLVSGNRLPFADGAIDLVYCISVLEHVPDVEGLVREIHRVLAPGGRFVLTFDLDLRGDDEIGIPEFYRLHETLDRFFVPAAPRRIPHHADILTSATSPARPHEMPWWRALPFLAKQWLVKPLLGRRPAPLVPFHATVQGVLLSKPA